MLEEESQYLKAEVQSAASSDWLPFCCLPGRAEEVEGGDAGKVCLQYRRLRQGVAPVYRCPLLSASGGSAFAAAPAAPPGSEQYSIGPLRVQPRQTSLLGWELG